MRTSEKECPIPNMDTELNVGVETQRNWVERAEIHAGEREGLGSEECEELGRLRREVEALPQDKGFSEDRPPFSSGRTGVDKLHFLPELRKNRALAAPNCPNVGPHFPLIEGVVFDSLVAKDRHMKFSDRARHGTKFDTGKVERYRVRVGPRAWRGEVYPIMSNAAPTMFSASIP